MKIIYGYSNCSDKKYEELMQGKNIAILQPDQKYHGLLIKGLSKNTEKVECLSGLPVNRELTSKILTKERDEQEGNIHYHYYTTLNLPILRHIMIFFGAFTNCIKAKKEKETFALCDCLNIANAYGMALACKLRKIPIITIVTDLPNMMYGGKLLKGIGNNFFNIVDGYIFLTQQMNGVVNRKNKPYIVAEGHVDAGLQIVRENAKWENENGKRVVIYAGAISEMYGLKNLAEGFSLAKIPGSELWVFGDGDFKEELEKMGDGNVKYMGVCSNRVVVEQEQKAALLINPRPTAPEYTKYSFPSKNMEYMVSGTPVMTTRLPGMPEEYIPYIYMIEEETAEGIADSLKKFFSESAENRNEKGKRAREFVLKNKSNIVQAKRIIEFLRTF